MQKHFPSKFIVKRKIGCVRHPGTSTGGSQLQGENCTVSWQNLTTQSWPPTHPTRQAPVTLIKSAKQRVRNGGEKTAKRSTRNAPFSRHIGKETLQCKVLGIPRMRGLLGQRKNCVVMWRLGAWDMLELPLFLFFYHVTKFCYVTGIRNTGGHQYSPRTRVRALKKWPFLNITQVSPVQRIRDIVKRFLRVDMISFARMTKFEQDQ